MMKKGISPTVVRASEHQLKSDRGDKRTVCILVCLTPQEPVLPGEGR